MDSSVHIDQPRAVSDASAAAYIEFVGVEISTDTETTFDQSCLVKFAELALVNLGGRGVDMIGFDASFAGAVCWYSIMYTPPEYLASVCTELAPVDKFTPVGCATRSSPTSTRPKHLSSPNRLPYEC